MFLMLGNVSGIDPFLQILLSFIIAEDWQKKKKIKKKSVT